MLQSFLQDTWVTPTVTPASAVAVRDAVTGETVCHVSSEGLDVAGAFAHARRVGGPALRDLTFPQRADLLDAVAAAVRARREELYVLSVRAGATLTDARYDVDGGVRVLRDYAARARAELPDAAYLLEGPAERLARGEDFLGVHLVTPSPGLMLQVNAFNFPVWAPLEKLAQAVLAGMPSVVKPATPTAYLTEHLVRIVAEAGVLPPGALQMVVGSVRTALDLLHEQDVLSFTGSATTAATLRTHPELVARSVRFNAEADSVNAIVLAPDVEPGSPLFEAFVREVVTEMTVKAGQKCTAIRRVLVPREHELAALDAISAELAGVTIGNPGAEGVRMGPVVSLEQRDERTAGGARHRRVRPLRVRRPGQGACGGRRPGAGRLPGHAVDLRGPGRLGTPRGRTLRTGRDRAGVPRHRPRHGPGCARPWQPRGLGRRRRPRLDDRLRPGGGLLARAAPPAGLDEPDADHRARIPAPALRHGGPGRAGGDRRWGAPAVSWT